MEKRISFFIGAGAEVSYRMPNGGQFALELFRQPIDKAKDEFKKKLNKVNETTQYAANMFPKDFKSKNITAFNKKNFEALIESSLENKRECIYSYLDKFDDKVGVLIERNENYRKLGEIFKKLTNTTIENINYSGAIIVDEKLTKNNKLFNSNYFSAFLKIIEEDKSTDLLNKIVLSILELFIGANGQELVNSLNEGVFSKRPQKLNIIDELGGFFNLDYKSCGRTGLELVLDKSSESDISNEDIGIYEQFGLDIIKDIYSNILDYQSLIDANYRYIYSPDKNWGKFTKISVFLYAVRQYLIKCEEQVDLEIQGYYDDIKEISSIYEIDTVGTTNYTDIINKKLGTSINIYKLNGSLKEYYDPYLNSIISSEKEEKYEKFVVPFLFTQSGIKPLTSIEMSERYVNLFNNFNKSDIICVIGFGFNRDDGHINGLFRSLIDDKDKKVIILDYKFNPETMGLRTIERKKYFVHKLRIENADNLTICVIDNNRNNDDGDKWYKLFE